MKTISIMNLKGGVGKTTTSQNLATGLANAGKKVLLIDLDPQGNTTSNYYTSEWKDIHTIGELMFNNDLLDKTIKNTTVPNLDVIPANLELADMEQKMRSSNTVNFKFLEKIKRLIKNNYDYMIIDCSPYLNLLTVNAIYVSNEVIIPIKPDRFAVEGFKKTIRDILKLDDDLEKTTKMSVLFTMVGRSKDERMIIDEVSNQCKEVGIKVHSVNIRYQAKPITEASSNYKAVINGKTKVAEDYKELVNAIMEVE